MDFQHLFFRRLDDLRADLATHVTMIRQRLDATDRRLDTLERRLERSAPVGGDTDWELWLRLLVTLAASVLGGLALAALVNAVRSC